MASVVEKECFKTKYGIITVLTTSTFAEWYEDCSLVMSSIGAEGILDGTEIRPTAPVRAIEKYETKIQEAKVVLNGSVGRAYKAIARDFSRNDDISGLWNHLMELNPAKTPHFASSLQHEFHKVSFDPKNQTIQEVVNKLQRIQVQLQETELRQSDEMIRQQLLQALPTDEFWPNQRMYVLANKLTLNETILYLKSCEPIAPSRGPAQASISRGRGGIRDRGRGKNGRGGRKGRHNWDLNGRNDSRRDNRRRPGRGERKTWGKNQCKWCLKHGHYEADCDSYHFHRRQALGDKKTEEHSAAAGYSARIGPRRDENEYNISSYVSVASHSDKSRAFSASSSLHSIIDSGATEHFSGRRSDFKQIKRWSFPRTVTVANGKEVMCEGYGTIIINTDHNVLELDNVWFVPEFGNMRLISVWRLNDAGIESRFDDHQCQLWKNNNMIMSISGSNGLFEVSERTKSNALSITAINFNLTETTSKANNHELLASQSSSHQSQSTIGTPTSNQNRRFVRNEESIWELHHRRLGHVNFQDIKKLVDLGVLGGKVNLEKRPVYQGEKHCESCLAGRMKERFNKKTDTREYVKGRRLHADISGIQGVSVRGFRYYLAVVDDASRMYWVALLKSKETNEVLNILKQIIAMVELQCENKVWYFRADNGKSEFSLTFTEFLKERGIQFEPCPPYKHSMNGVAERAIGILATYARSMLFEAQLPHQFWDYAIEHAVWIRNRVPTSALPFGPDSSVSSRWKIPHSVWYEKLPKLDNLRPFGCVATIAYPSALLPQKWAPRSREGTSIFVGLRGESIFKLLHVETLQGWESADAKVDEYTYATVSMVKDNLTDVPTSQAYRRTSDYVPKPIVGRPKGVKQRRFNSRPLNSMPTEEATRGSADVLYNTLNGSTSIRNATRGSVDAPHDPLTRLRNPPQSAEHLATQDVRSAPGELELSLIPAEDAPSAHRELAPLRELALSDEVTTSSSSVERSSTAVELPEASDQRVQDVHAGALVHLDVQKPAFGQTCSGRAVFINSEKSTPLSDPTPIYESITIDQAMEEDQAGWIEAITKELKALETTGTFTLLRGNPPKSRNLISSRLVLRHKIGANSMETIKKARVVARGFEQQAGIDYFETFASVVRYNTLRIILAISAVEDLEVDSIDINTAFLNPPLKEETYLEIPPFFELLDPSANRNTHYLKLNKSLYGLKQAPHEWFMMVKDFFVKLGLKAGNSDPNLFIGLGVYILLFVDDMLIVGKRPSVDKIKASILRNWKGKDLKTAKLFVGFEIERDRLRRSIIIRQTIYIKKLLERMGMAKCNSNDLPIPAGTVLKESEESDLLKEDEAGLYRQIIGSVIYLANNTRPDIAYAVGQLARFMSKPGTLHLKMAKHLLRYLQGTQDLGIQYRGQDQQTTQYSAWTDATWGTETDRKSFQGYVVIWHGGAISWAANRQKSTALSTMEAEIMAASEGARELAWMEKVCSDLGLKFDNPPTLRIDNEPAIDLSKATKFHTKAKHIEIRHFYIRNDMVQRNRIEVVHTPGTDQIADVLTKQLPKDQFRKLLRGFGLK